MKKTFSLLPFFVLALSCSEPESFGEDQASFRSAQLALDLQQLGVSLASSDGIAQGSLDILNHSIDAYSKDFVAQHQRAAGDFSITSLTQNAFRSLKDALGSPLETLQNYLLGSDTLDRKKMEKILPDVPGVLKDMVAPLLETSQKLYTLDESSSPNLKKIVKGLEQQVKNIRQQADNLPPSLKNGALVLGDVVEAINWAAEPFYAGSTAGALAWQQQQEVLTRGNSEEGCSPFYTIFYAVARRIPNALVGAVQGALTAVSQDKEGGEILKSSLVGAAQGFMKTPADDSAGKKEEEKVAAAT